MLKRRRIYISFIHIPKKKEDKTFKKLERKLQQIKFNSTEWKRLVKITAIILFLLTTPVSAAGPGGISVLGQKVYEILLDISAWYAIIGCALDLLKCGFNGNINSAGKIVLNYIMIYASIAMLPWVIDMIKGVLR